MKKQFFLLILVLFGAVYFSSLNNNGLSACDKNCHAMYLTIKKTAARITAVDYEEDEYSKLWPQMPFVTL